jgi:hypothetical protein
MNENRAWIAHGSETSEHEDLLIGNRSGLEALEAAIHRALMDGEAPIKEPGIEFLGVRVVETDPRKERGPMTLKDKICLFLLILLLGFLLYALTDGLDTLSKR